jgi:hypothetical protein
MEDAFRTRLLNVFPCFLAAFSLAGGGEFAGIADNQPSLAGDQVEVRKARPAGKVFDIPSISARLPCQVFIEIISIYITENQSITLV